MAPEERQRMMSPCCTSCRSGLRSLCNCVVFAPPFLIWVIISFPGIVVSSFGSGIAFVYTYTLSAPSKSA